MRAVRERERSGSLMKAKSSAPQRGRVHPQIAWAKLRSLRDGVALSSKKLWS